MEEWIQEIKAGNDMRLEESYRKYLPLVLNVEKSYHLKNLDEEDWYQEGFIVFYNSVKTYNCKKGVTFGLYFKKNFIRHIISLLRKEQAYKRKGDLEATSFEDYFQVAEETNPSLYPNVYEEIDERIFTCERYQDFLDQLSTEDYDTLTLYLFGYNVPEIALLMARRDSRVRKDLHRIRWQLRKHLLQGAIAKFKPKK